MFNLQDLKDNLLIIVLLVTLPSQPEGTSTKSLLSPLLESDNDSPAFHTPESVFIISQCWFREKMKYYVYTIIANSIAFAKSADQTDNVYKSDDPGIIFIASSVQEDFLQLSEGVKKSSRCPKNFRTKLNYKNQNIDFDWVLNSGISGHLSKNRNGLKFLDPKIQCI